jgi:hypothetical protein
MANPNWGSGIVSPNPEGRRKTRYSARLVKGMVENFLKRNITPRKLQQMFNALSEKDKLQMLMKLLPSEQLTSADFKVIIIGK